MYGGARQLESTQQTDMFLLGDIGDYKEVSDNIAIGVASLVGLDIGLLVSRFAQVGGYSLNTYFDTFGLEAVVADSCLIMILFQIARWAYTTFYTSGGRPWSPFVFVCFLLAAQVVHNLFIYYGILKSIPAGKNEMIDALRRYAGENGSRAITGHAALLIIISAIAMIFKESSVLFIFLIGLVSLYGLIFLLTTVGPKPPPPPPPPPKKDPFEQKLLDPRF